MKNKYLLLASLLMLSISGHAQEPQQKPTKESLNGDVYTSAEIGDLELLAQRVYNAFLIYTTGKSHTFVSHNLPVNFTGRSKNLRNKKNSNDILPVIIDITDGELEPVPIDADNAKMQTPVHKIESIEVIHGISSTAQYGAKGIPCVIKVKFKKN